MGRYITPEELKPLINIPGGSLSASSYNSTNQTADLSKVLPSLSQTSPSKVQILGPNSIAAYHSYK